MPSLPFLVALLIEKARNRNKQTENVDEDVNGELEHSEPRDHRIDIQDVDSSEPTRVSSSPEARVSSPSPRRKRRQYTQSLVAYLLTLGFAHRTAQRLAICCRKSCQGHGGQCRQILLRV